MLQVQMRSTSLAGAKTYQGLRARIYEEQEEKNRPRAKKALLIGHDKIHISWAGRLCPDWTRAGGGP
ncbi:hypothetical protein IF1G_04397 [Cordyceps javanica]|uniref:Uncharacterized protein n=1 Tax=Cordyceps javanica TaxID=43265 RepID=A0A545V621_9HYPO|nr:hypothetical protein IF1G_04397 [Cordyceps javanica]